MMFKHADGQPVLELDDEQSWELLEGTKHGRLVVSVAGEPDIFPVNYVTCGPEDLPADRARATSWPS